MLPLRTNAPRTLPAAASVPLRQIRFPCRRWCNVSRYRRGLYDYGQSLTPAARRAAARGLTPLLWNSFDAQHAAQPVRRPRRHSHAVPGRANTYAGDLRLALRFTSDGPAGFRPDGCRRNLRYCEPSGLGGMRAGSVGDDFEGVSVGRDLCTI